MGGKRGGALNTPHGQHTMVEGFFLDVDGGGDLKNGPKNCCTCNIIYACVSVCTFNVALLALQSKDENCWYSL